MARVGETKVVSEANPVEVRVNGDGKITARRRGRHSRRFLCLESVDLGFTLLASGEAAAALGRAGVRRRDLVRRMQPPCVYRHLQRCRVIAIDLLTPPRRDSA